MTSLMSASGFPGEIPPQRQLLRQSHLPAIDPVMMLQESRLASLSPAMSESCSGFTATSHDDFFARRHDGADSRVHLVDHDNRHAAARETSTSHYSWHAAAQQGHEVGSAAAGPWDSSAHALDERRSCSGTSVWEQLDADNNMWHKATTYNRYQESGAASFADPALAVDSPPFKGCKPASVINARVTSGSGHHHAERLEDLPDLRTLLLGSRSGTPHRTSSAGGAAATKPSKNVSFDIPPCKDDAMTMQNEVTRQQAGKLLCSKMSDSHRQSAARFMPQHRLSLDQLHGGALRMRPKHQFHDDIDNDTAGASSPTSSMLPYERSLLNGLRNHEERRKLMSMAAAKRHGRRVAHCGHATSPKLGGEHQPLTTTVSTANLSTQHRENALLARGSAPASAAGASSTSSAAPVARSRSYPPWKADHHTELKGNPSEVTPQMMESGERGVSTSLEVTETGSVQVRNKIAPAAGVLITNHGPGDVTQQSSASVETIEESSQGINVKDEKLESHAERNAVATTAPNVIHPAATKPARTHEVQDLLVQDADKGMETRPELDGRPKLNLRLLELNSLPEFDGLADGGDRRRRGGSLPASPNASEGPALRALRKKLHKTASSYDETSDITHSNSQCLALPSPGNWQQQRPPYRPAFNVPHNNLQIQDGHKNACLSPANTSSQAYQLRKAATSQLCSKTASFASNPDRETAMTIIVDQTYKIVVNFPPGWSGTCRVHLPEGSSAQAAIFLTSKSLPSPEFRRQDPAVTGVIHEH